MTYRSHPIPVELLLSRPVKQICSALYVSGRSGDEAIRNSALWWEGVADVLYEYGEVSNDTDTRTVSFTFPLDDETVPRLVDAYRSNYPDFEADWDAEAQRLSGLGSVTRRARYHGDHGCAILPLQGDEMHFEPVELATSLQGAGTLDWPMGDRPAGEPFPEHVDKAKVDAAVNAAFADPAAYTAAFVALHKGQIIGERYGAGAHRDMQLESWSMGKSITSTLIGMLVHEGHFGLDDPAPVTEWQAEDDPRGEITLRDLLRMSSGLRCSGRLESRTKWELGVADHVYPYHEAINVFDFMIARPPEHPPNTVGRYRNSDPLTLGAIARRTIEAQGEEYLTWPQRKLFDRIGIRKQVMETDLWGNFILSGFDFGTARNWARLGQLYLQGGVWDGERILADGWTEFVSAPAPAWEEPEYGGQFWLNRSGKEPNLPRDAYWMSGVGLQRVVIVPSLDLVVVRMGHLRAMRGRPASVPGPAENCLSEALGLLWEAIDPAGRASVR
jgi:CubicO group peptidase (beta-lactamase class C family)